MKRLMINTFFLTVFVFLTGYFNQSFGAERTVEIKKEFQTTLKENDGSSQFEEVIEKEGIKYQLKSLHTDRVEMINPAAGITLDSAPFVGSPKGYEPRETLEKDGKKYHLTTSEILDITTEEKTDYTESSVFYNGVEYIDRLPEEAEVQVMKEELNLELTVKLPAVSFEEERNYWAYDFAFPITVSGYQENSYLLGNTEIPNGASLIDYTEAFLNYLNLPQDYYEITNISWDDEPEKHHGDTIRRARASGRKRVKDIRGIYGGEVTFPSVQAKIYRGIYEEEGAENKSGHMVYKKSVTAVYEPQTGIGFRKILIYLCTITVALTVFLLVLLIILVIIKKKKRPVSKD